MATITIDETQVWQITSAEGWKEMFRVFVNDETTASELSEIIKADRQNAYPKDKITVVLALNKNRDSMVFLPSNAKIMSLQKEILEARTLYFRIYTSAAPKK